jgi:predicted transposase YdaD
LRDPIFEKEIGIFEMSSRTPDQRRHYYSRLKWQLDENTRIQTAFEEGEAKGRMEGRLEVETIGKIRILQELLQMPVSGDEAFEGKSLDELRQQASLLQDKIRNCSSS